jgi:hypothetical protein
MSPSLFEYPKFPKACNNGQYQLILLFPEESFREKVDAYTVLRIVRLPNKKYRNSNA